LFVIGNKKATYSDFAKYIEGRQKTTRPYRSKESLLVDFYDEFETQQLKEYFKENLENENDEYAAILNEYRDGLLIFDVMDKNIWQKGKTDTIAVQEYFNRTQQDYQWKQRIDADIYAATTDIFAKQIQEMLTQGKTADEVKKVLNAENKV